MQALLSLRRWRLPAHSHMRLSHSRAQLVFYLQINTDLMCLHYAHQLPSVWPQRTWTLLCLYPGPLLRHGWIRGFKAKTETETGKRVSAWGTRAIFWVFAPLKAKMYCLQLVQPSLSATLTQLLLKYPRWPSLFAFACSLYFCPFTGRLQSADVYTVPVDWASLRTAELPQTWGLVETGQIAIRVFL